MRSVACHQKEVLEAARILAQTEGLIAAPETAHGLRLVIDEALRCRESGEARGIAMNYSGHGLLDLGAYEQLLLEGWSTMSLRGSRPLHRCEMGRGAEERWNPSSRYLLMPIDDLRLQEKGLPLYLKLIEEELLRDGILKHPIIVDEGTGVILNGMHRWLALRRLGYTHIPVLLVDYLKNPRIRIGCRRVQRYLEDDKGDILQDRGHPGRAKREPDEPPNNEALLPLHEAPVDRSPPGLPGEGLPEGWLRCIEETTVEECKTNKRMA